MARRQFRPSLFGTILMLLAVALFSVLAWWQWQRAQYKNSLQVHFEQSRTLPPIEIGKGKIGIEDVSVDEHRFRRARAAGRYLPKQTVLVDNVVREGRAGYAVITPLLMEGGGAVVVDRGWTPLGGSRSELPLVETPVERVEIVGSVDRPAGKPFGLDEKILQQSVNDKVWPWLDLAVLAARSGLAITPYLLRLEAGQPGALVVRISTFNARVGMHIAYAVQWAAFAMIAFMVYLRLSLREVEQ